MEEGEYCTSIHDPKPLTKSKFTLSLPLAIWDLRMATSCSTAAMSCREAAAA